jgi:phosphatidylserine/phosphatidylglycerophosphate/cardiolipin synthase-like enzyme
VPHRVTDVADRVAGEGVERLVRLHHHRRLRRIDRVAQLDPPSDGAWAAGDPPPRPGCSLDVLIDGAQALPAVQRALEGARHWVHIAGWHVTPGFGLTRDDAARPLRDLLGELAERVEVRVLLWGGAPAPVFHPTRSAVRAVRDELTRGSRVQVALDVHERPMHCHHEKLVIVDGEVAFVNGIDLTTLAGDRYDDAAHRVRGGLGWHDVGTRLRGPAVTDVAEHFAARWEAVEGVPAPSAPAAAAAAGVPAASGVPAAVGAPAASAAPAAPADPGPPAPAGDLTVQVVRTVPEKVYDFAPRGDFRILEAYTRALRSARSLIYLEDQFLWSPEVTAILHDKLADPPADDFRIVLLLPAKANNGADDTRGQLSLLVQADDGGRRLLATTIRSRTGGVTANCYVHAKVGIVDDAWLTIGSANLNEHSLFNDTEMNVVTLDPGLARATRLRLWAEHLERRPQDVDGQPARVVDELWRPIAREQLERRKAGASATHRLCELPGVSRRARTILGPLKGLADDG